MRSGGRRLAALLLGALACGGSGDEAAPETPAAAPRPQAVAILEPPRLEIGEVAVLEVAVSVPTGSRVTALPVPEETPGLWVLSVEGPERSARAGHDVHLTRFRVRARETGAFVWPGSEILAFAPDGEELRLVLEPRPFRVETVRGDLPQPRSFFSYREPGTVGEPLDTGSLWLAGAAGALLAFALVALVAFVRRVRRARLAPAEPDAPPAPWRSTQSALAAAAELSATDPVRAADMASAALRVYVDRRFRARTSVATTEELRAGEPPFLLTTRWERLLDLLERLDALRFPPPAALEREALEAAIADAQAFVEDATPRGNLEGGGAR